MRVIFFTDAGFLENYKAGHQDLTKSFNIGRIEFVFFSGQRVLPHNFFRVRVMSLVDPRQGDSLGDLNSTIPSSTNEKAIILAVDAGTRKKSPTRCTSMQKHISSFFVLDQSVAIVKKHPCGRVPFSPFISIYIILYIYIKWVG